MEDVTIRPKPVKPALDVWLGGAQPRELERVGRLSDGWLPSFLTPEEAAARRPVIERAHPGADSLRRKHPAELHQ